MPLLRRAAATIACLTAALTVPAVRATAATGGLPLGDPDLAESRSSQPLAPGVTLTRIVRGTDPAPPDQINTTTRGPWSVNVLTIDPRKASGHLEATFGPDLAAANPTTDLVRLSGALAGVNASFFTFTANPRFPGDPVGLGLYDGRLLSEPTTDPTEADVVPLHRGVYGVNGRFRLVADGENVVPDGSGSFFDRNPRTIAGTTRDHEIVLATIDGRLTTSVGTALDETAAVALALGMRDAVNLDGGGSTTMSVRGGLINHPSGSGERAVGDALVYIP